MKKRKFKKKILLVDYEKTETNYLYSVTDEKYKKFEKWFAQNYPPLLGKHEDEDDTYFYRLGGFLKYDMNELLRTFRARDKFKIIYNPNNKSIEAILFSYEYNEPIKITFKPFSVDYELELDLKYSEEDENVYLTHLYYTNRKKLKLKNKKLDGILKGV